MAAPGCTRQGPSPQLHPAGPSRTCAGASTSYAQPAAPQRRRGSQRQPPQQRAAAAAAAATAPAVRRPALRCAASVRPVLAGGEIVEVKALNGIRIMKNEDDSPRVEYLVQWKDDSPDTW